MTYETVVVFFMAVCCVTCCAVIHLHPVPGIRLISGDIFPPYIYAVAGDTIFLIRRKAVRAPMFAVTGAAIELPVLDVRYMGKIDAIRLLIILIPLDLFQVSDVFIQEIFLFNGFTKRICRIIMAFHAF